MVVGDGKRGELIEIELALAVKLDELWAHRAELEALLHHRPRHAEAPGDVLGAHAMLAVQLGEGLVLVSRMHRALHRVLGEADFLGDAALKHSAGDA